MRRGYNFSGDEVGRRRLGAVPFEFPKLLHFGTRRSVPCYWREDRRRYDK